MVVVRIDKHAIQWSVCLEPEALIEHSSKWVGTKEGVLLVNKHERFQSVCNSVIKTIKI